MTSPDLAAIEARLTAATDTTPEPWEVGDGWVYTMPIYDDDRRLANVLGMSYANPQRAEAEKDRAQRNVEFIANAPDDMRVLLNEVERLHSWDGLMELLDEHWPEWMMPTLPDREGRDPGPRIVSLLRWVNRLEAERHRYRAAWQSARRRAKRLQDVDIEIVWEERDRVAATLTRIRELCDSYDDPVDDGTYIDDPGCPHCGDFSDPDQPNLHARCRQIPDAEARRDGA